MSEQYGEATVLMILKKAGQLLVSDSRGILCYQAHKAIEIARGELECYFSHFTHNIDPKQHGYLCYYSDKQLNSDCPRIFLMSHLSAVLI